MSKPWRKTGAKLDERMVTIVLDDEYEVPGDLEANSCADAVFSDEEIRVTLAHVSHERADVMPGLPANAAEPELVARAPPNESEQLSPRGERSVHAWFKRAVSSCPAALAPSGWRAIAD